MIHFDFQVVWLLWFAVVVISAIVHELGHWTLARFYHLHPRILFSRRFFRRGGLGIAVHIDNVRNRKVSLSGLLIQSIFLLPVVYFVTGWLGVALAILPLLGGSVFDLHDALRDVRWNFVFHNFNRLMIPIISVLTLALALRLLQLWLFPSLNCWGLC